MSRNGHFRVLVFWRYYTPSSKPLFYRDHLKGNVNSALVALICAYFEICVSHWFLKGPAKVAVLSPLSRKVWERLCWKNVPKSFVLRGNPCESFVPWWIFQEKISGLENLYHYVHFSTPAVARQKVFVLALFDFEQIWWFWQIWTKSWFEILKIKIEILEINFEKIF